MKGTVKYSKLAGYDCARESILPHEGKFLASLVGLISARVIVEIGSWIGVSTIYLAWGVRENNGVVYTIDPHEGSNLHRRRGIPDTEALLKENLSRFEVEKWVRVMRMTSIEACKRWASPVFRDQGSIPTQIDLLFLDGDPLFAEVRKDFSGWTPWIPVGGVIAFHDYPRWSGVRKVVDKIVRPSGLWEELGHIHNLIAFRRQT